jgi:hypothetical protein
MHEAVGRCAGLTDGRSNEPGVSERADSVVDVGWVDEARSGQRANRVRTVDDVTGAVGRASSVAALCVEAMNLQYASLQRGGKLRTDDEQRRTSGPKVPTRSCRCAHRVSSSARGLHPRLVVLLGSDRGGRETPAEAERDHRQDGEHRERGAQSVESGLRVLVHDCCRGGASRAATKTTRPRNSATKPSWETRRGEAFGKTLGIPMAAITSVIDRGRIRTPVSIAESPSAIDKNSADRRVSAGPQ